MHRVAPVTDDPFQTLQDAPKLLAPVAVAYNRRLGEWGARARGVFWRNEEGQRLRFEVLARAMEGAPAGTTVNDLGCGYGAFFDFLAGHPALVDGTFAGYDISEDMIEKARQRIGDKRARFVHSLIATDAADYSFASGTFNLNLDADIASWKGYVEASLAHLWSRTRLALGFNMLAGNDVNREGLFYGEPRGFLDFCRRHLSADATLMDDYPLKEWTIVVRR